MNGRFLTGMDAYSQHWDGELCALMEPTTKAELDNDLARAGDIVGNKSGDLPFRLELGDYRDPSLSGALKPLAVST